MFSGPDFGFLVVLGGGVLVGGLSLVLRGGLVNFWGSGLIFWSSWAVSGLSIGLGGLVLWFLVLVSVPDYLVVFLFPVVCML